MPFEEYSRGSEGRLVKGVQRGAVSFGTSSASAVVQLTQNLVTLVQVSISALHPPLNRSHTERRRTRL